MRSQVARKIQDETPKEVTIWVRQYSNILVRVNQIIRDKIQERR